MTNFVVKLERSLAASLGTIRCRAAVDVCENNDELWVRVSLHDDELETAVRALPGTRFIVQDDGQLVQYDQRVPRGYLPDDGWVPLKEWMQVEIGAAAFAGKTDERVRLKLVRGGEPAEANLLLTSATAWRDYVVNAPQIRLDRLAFAMNGNGDVLVRGTPLPPLTGTRFVERSGVAVPVGWTWTPAIDVAVVRTALRLEQGDVALLHVDEAWDQLRSDDFVRATRSVARASVAKHD